LKRSAEAERRRKSAPLELVISMFSSSINRAEQRGSGRRRLILESALDELRRSTDGPSQCAS
jgi:hypothetical protein